jgi:hypothetical protein
MVRVQVGCWGNSRLLLDERLRQQCREQHNARVKVLPTAKRSPVPRHLQMQYAMEKNALPPTKYVLGDACYPNDLSRSKRMLARMDEQLASGRCQAALVDRFGHGIVCLPTVWQGME